MTSAVACGSAGPMSVAVIGAGPAGLTAAYQLATRGIPVTVLEADPHHLGGLSRTVEHGGFHVDIGGHRFFSKAPEVEALWREWLPDDLLERRRSSRIYYRGQFFNYPLKAGEALRKLGPIEAVRCVASYGRARLAPISSPVSFEQWVTNQFGRRLFEIFFKTYTEKVWGMSCAEISADWAAQRIRGLSLGSAIVQACRPSWGRSRGGDATIKTLAQTFRYPRRGPGMMWDACAARIRAAGGVILQGRRAVRCALAGGRWAVTHAGGDGGTDTLDATHLVCSAPLGEIVGALSPPVSERSRNAAARLRYRDFLIVALMLTERHQLSDQWIYIHDPGVRVARVQNFKAWSPDMAPGGPLCCYGLEYFCSPADGLAAQPDRSLLDLATNELAWIGLADRSDVVDGFVVRQSKAYPVYDDDYASHVGGIREELEERFPTLHVVGRNGMHKYNNQDHAMVTAMLTVENILAGRRAYDVWRVNSDAEYLEDAPKDGSTGLRLVPRRMDSLAGRLNTPVYTEADPSSRGR